MEFFIFFELYICATTLESYICATTLESDLSVNLMRFFPSIRFCDSYFNYTRFRKWIFDALGFVIEIGYRHQVCIFDYFISPFINSHLLLPHILWIYFYTQGVLGFAKEMLNAFGFAIYISTGLDFVILFSMHWFLL